MKKWDKNPLRAFKIKDVAFDTGIPQEKNIGGAFWINTTACLPYVGTLVWHISC